MTCDEIRGRVSAEIDGELPPAESAAVRAHLGACPACGRQSSLLRAAREAFRATRRRSPALRSIATATVAVVLAVAVAAAWGRWRSPEGPATDPSVPRKGGRVATEGIDCGRPDASVCIVEVPCGDGWCGSSNEHLRTLPGLRPALDARPAAPGLRGFPPRDV